MSTVEGRYFEELAVGQVFDWAPAVTLTDALASAHQAITGDRLLLPLDHHLAQEVTGEGTPAHPALVWNIAIGQSTLATQHVKANLFYRGLVLRRSPLLGDTLRTSVEVVALRQNKPREGRHPTGLAALRITTTDQHGRPVLDFQRCAMVSLRDGAVRTGHNDPMADTTARLSPEILAEPLRGWKLDRFAVGTRPGPEVALESGKTYEIGGGDVVTSAPELARLTLNIASAHHDARAAGGERLVYGGHTIAVALAQVTRAFPRLVTVPGWYGCDHLGPVREGDTLHSSVTIERVRALPGPGKLADLRSRVRTADDREVLDWRFVAVIV
jgi:acyl dehydratase